MSAALKTIYRLYGGSVSWSFDESIKWARKRGDESLNEGAVILKWYGVRECDDEYGVNICLRE